MNTLARGDIVLVTPRRESQPVAMLIAQVEAIKPIHVTLFVLAGWTFDFPNGEKFELILPDGATDYPMAQFRFERLHQ